VACARRCPAGKRLALDLVVCLPCRSGHWLPLGMVEQRPIAPNGNILRDEVILPTAIQEQGMVARMRRIETWIAERNEAMVFMTNHLKLADSTAASIYRDQSLRIKTFVGTSPNSVMIQIWTGLVAMALLRYRQPRAIYGWTLSNLVALLRQRLFVLPFAYNGATDLFHTLGHLLRCAKTPLRRLPKTVFAALP
jgi:hypothetical protein